MNSNRRWHIAICGALLFASASSGDDPNKQKAVKAELKKLEGKWRVISAEQGGKPGDTSDTVVTFAGDKVTIADKQLNITLESTFVIDVTRNPKWIDVTNPKQKRSWPGIYELNGDTMKGAYQSEKDGPRPTEFKTTADNGVVLYTYERIKAK